MPELQVYIPPESIAATVWLGDRHDGPRSSMFKCALSFRANAYREAGADCLFVPAVTDADVIARLARAIRGPLNILAGPGAPSVAELQRLGVARVSTGSAFMRASFAKARDVARDILTAGSWESLLSNTISYPEMNMLASERPADSKGSSD